MSSETHWTFFLIFILLTLPVIPFVHGGYLIEQTRQIGRKHLIVILVEFADIKHTVDTSRIQDVALRQLNEYFTEQSYNKTWIVGELIPKWYSLSGAFADYEPSPAHRFSEWSKVEKLNAQAIRAANEDKPITASDYVAIVRAGHHRDNYAFGGPLNENYCVRTKQGCASRVLQVDEDDGVGNYAHEFTHLLGLPDLYNENVEPVFAGMWDILSGAPHGYDNPQGMLGWDRLKLGWISSERIVEVTSPARLTNITLNPLEHSKGIVLAKISIPKSDPTHYYLVEVRQPIGFDKNLNLNPYAYPRPADAYGVLISLADDTKMGFGQTSGMNLGAVRVVANEPSRYWKSAAHALTLPPSWPSGTLQPRMFVDPTNNLSIGVVSQNKDLSFTIMVGGVENGRVLGSQIDETLNMLRAAAQSLLKAQQDGRTTGFDEAKQVYEEANEAYYSGSLQLARDLASQAKTGFDLATKPMTASETITSSISTPITPATQIQPTSLVLSMTVVAIVSVVVVAIVLSRKKTRKLC